MSCFGAAKAHASSGSGKIKAHSAVFVYVLTLFNPPVPCCNALQDYKAAQKVAAEREAQYLPKVPPAAAAASSAAAAAAAAGTSEADIESQALLQEQVQQESRAMDNTISFQEALIEERDLGIAGAIAWNASAANGTQQLVTA